MKYALIFLLLLPLLGQDSATASGQTDRWRVSDTTQRGRAIKSLFDRVEAEELGNKKFAVVISDCLDQWTDSAIYFLAWFYYSCDDKEIAVHYFDFPKMGNGLNKYFYFDKFLEGVALTKAVPKNAKRLTMPLPVGLSDEVLLDKMHKVPSPLRDNEGYYVSYSKAGRFVSYTFGVKSEQIEFVRDHNSFIFSPEGSVRVDFIDPIRSAILKQEWPDGWKEDPEDSFAWEEIIEETIIMSEQCEGIEKIGMRPKSHEQ